MASSMKRVLIVANQTAGGRHLRSEVQRRVKRGPHAFTFLVPATKPSGGFTWTEGQAHKVAEERMKKAIDGMKDIDASFDGVVGVERPMDAIADLLREREFDEIIISTLPHKISHWLKLDLPSRVAYRFDLPVTHIVASGAEEHAA